MNIRVNDNKLTVRIMGIGMLVAVSILLSACTSSSASEKDALALKPDEGLLGFVLVNSFGNVNFQVKLAGFTGKMLNMNNVQAGENVYLYKMKAGKYCVQALYLSNSDHYLNWGTNRNCFEVTAGKLTYGGTLVNTVPNNYLVDMDDFLRLLKSIYPDVYEKYVTGPKSVGKPIL